MEPTLISTFTATFVTFFVLMDALGVAPVFVALTAQGDAAYRRRMAVKSVLVAAIITYGFAFFGAWLLGAMHISIDAFRAAGGVLLFLIAIEMVFEKSTQRRESKVNDALEHNTEAQQPEDISVFPMAIPMIAGPGTIASSMLYMSNSATWTDKGVVILALGLNLLICMLTCLAAGPVVRAMGASVSGAVTRILGVILAALSVQLVIDGIKGAFGVA
ncbi:MAG: MarC family protein [Planctomycetota bacterium]|nr:MarC family protein [Planctomycetota bacterium]